MKIRALATSHSAWGFAVSMTSLSPFPLFLSLFRSLLLLRNKTNSPSCLMVYSQAITFSNKNIPLEFHPLYQAACRILSLKYSALPERNSGNYDTPHLHLITHACKGSTSLGSGRVLDPHTRPPNLRVRAGVEHVGQWGQAREGEKHWDSPSS